MTRQFKGTRAEQMAKEMEAITRPFRAPGVTFRLVRNADSDENCALCNDSGSVKIPCAREASPCAACQSGYLMAEKHLDLADEAQYERADPT